MVTWAVVSNSATSSCRSVSSDDLVCLLVPLRAHAQTDEDISAFRGKQFNARFARSPTIEHFLSDIITGAEGLFKKTWTIQMADILHTQRLAAQDWWLSCSRLLRTARLTFWLSAAVGELTRNVFWVHFGSSCPPCIAASSAVPPACLHSCSPASGSSSSPADLH